MSEWNELRVFDPKDGNTLVAKLEADPEGPVDVVFNDDGTISLKWKETVEIEWETTEET